MTKKLYSVDQALQSWQTRFYSALLSYKALELIYRKLIKKTSMYCSVLLLARAAVRSVVGMAIQSNHAQRLLEGTAFAVGKRSIINQWLAVPY